jgi:hypothetical protein
METVFSLDAACNHEEAADLRIPHQLGQHHGVSPQAGATGSFGTMTRGHKGMSKWTGPEHAAKLAPAA